MVSLGIDPDRLFVDNQAVGNMFNRAGENTMDRIIHEKMRQRSGIGQVIYRHDLDIFVTERQLSCHSADSAKTINGYA